MSEAKMRITQETVIPYLERIASESKRNDAWKLYEIFNEESNYEPALWADKIIGFGTMTYRYASGHSGIMPYSAFAVQTSKFTLYVMLDDSVRKPLLDRLGKHKAGKGCIYFNKLADIDTHVLREIIRANETASLMYEAQMRSESLE